MPPPQPTIFIKRNLLNEIKVNYDERLKIFFLNQYTVKIKSSETSNKNINNIIIKKLEEYKIPKRIK